MKLSEFKEKYNLKLTQQQLAALDSVGRPTLLLAVPGSGKTTTLVSRIGYMIYGLGINPESILTMTYTVAASKDMKKRYEKLFGSEFSDRLKFSTINSICAGIIYTYNPNGFQIVENCAPIIREAFIKVQKTFPEEYDLKQVQVAISYIKNMMFTTDEIKEEFEDSDYDIPKIFEEYEKIMRGRRQMDFDDQLVYAFRILKRYPELLKKYQDKYKYYLVDEAQDTSKIQHEIIRLLTGNSQEVFMVGDEDQSIYGFRAAYPQALMDFPAYYNNAQVLLLEENFRSTPEIVRLADQFIARNKHRHEKHMITNNPSTSSVDKIVCLRKNQYDVLSDYCNGTNEETAILYRNNDSSIPIIYKFRKEGIVCRWKDNEPIFFTNPTVSMVVDILNLVLSPADGERFLRLYYKLKTTLKKEEANLAVKLCKDNNKADVLSEARKIPNLAESKVEKITNVLLNLRSYRKKDMVYILQDIEKNYNYYKDTEHFFILQQLAEPGDTIECFLKKLLELKEYIEAGSKEKDAKVILSTIHSSKGLEYESVILIDVLEGIFSMSLGKALDITYADEMEEDRRIFYVAATRAIKKLRIVETDKSPFIDDFFAPNTKKVERCRKNGPAAGFLPSGKTKMNSLAIPIGASSAGFKMVNGKSPADEYKKRTQMIETEPKETIAAHSMGFHSGDKLEHVKFGAGEVILVDNRYMTVRFASVTTKLNIETSVNYKLIKRI